MFGEKRTRTLLGPADPARDTAVAPPRLSARDLIARAEATPELVVGRRPARPTRRLVLAAGALTVAAGAAAALRRLGESTGDGPVVANPPARLGPVLVPIAYQFDSRAPAAGPQLRALAGRIGDAPYENHTGHYLYQHTRTWGATMMGSGDGRTMSVPEEVKIWHAADGSGKQITDYLEPQFPDQESRDYWQHVMRATPFAALDPNSGPQTLQLWPSDPVPPLPSTRAQLFQAVKAEFGTGDASKWTMELYRRYALPRQTRAETLRLLADLPAFRWRGKVTDRAGRPGVAITFDDRAHNAQHLLIFNPNTGELLAYELVSLSPVRMSSYMLILETDRTDQLG